VCKIAKKYLNILLSVGGRLFKKAKEGSFNKVNGANNKEVGSVKSFNAA